MACYSPQECVIVYDAATMEHRYSFFNRKKDECVQDLALVKGEDKIITVENYPAVPERGLPPLKVDWLYRFQDVACKRCSSCAIDYSKSWACRLMNESEQYPPDQCWFITLTYSSDSKEESRITALNGPRIDRETGEVEFPLCLNFKDVQDFVKRLRDYYSHHYPEDSHIKYYYAGEYGSKNGRPHYHMIIFGLQFHTPLEVVKITPLHQPLYTNSEIEKLWSHGFISIGQLTLNSAAYVARYVTKKWRNKAEEKFFYERMKLTPEATHMSTKPAIGLEWYEDHKDEIWQQGSINMLTYKNKVVKLRPPSYYESIYERENPEEFEKYKDQRRRSAQEQQKIRLENTDLTPEEYNKVQADKLDEKLKKLKREL